MTRRQRTQMVAAAMGATLLWAGTALAGDPEQSCQKERAKAWGKYQLCVENVVAKVYGGASFDYFKAFWKCRHKYFGLWAKFQTKGSLETSTCIGDRFTDNVTTVTDNLTGLIWEKKTDDGSVHDKNNHYSWSTGSPYDGDGTAYTGFLTGPGTGLNVGSGFSGANGWRLPRLAELQTILQDFPCTGTGGDATCVCPPPCIAFTDSTPSDYSYWSSTSFAAGPYYAWAVVFNGGVSAGTKVNARDVRAVRGGL